MTQSEIEMHPDGDDAVVEEVRESVSDLVNNFSQFQVEIKSQIQHQEQRMNMLDRKSISVARPKLSRSAETELPHKKAMSAYLRTGDDDALRGLDLEAKGMSTTVNSDGGYLVDPQTADTVKSSLKAAASLRAVSQVVTVEASSYDVLVDHADIGAGWANETSAVSETDTPRIDRISIPLHELSALPKASQRLLDDAAFDIEGWLAQRISDKFTRSESAAFINGDGIDKPRGILTAPTAPSGTETWGNLGYITTGAVGDFDTTNPGDALVELVYSLGAQYRANATFVMNSKTAGLVRKIKDNDGRFLWSDSLSAGEPARLMGYPVLICEDMPDADSEGFAIAIGDFMTGYTVVERPDLRILRDPFSAKPHVLFYATKRVGGDITDFNAIKLLKFAAS